MIKLSHNYSITVDERGYVLSQIKIRTTGKAAGTEYHSDMQYYSTLESALLGFWRELKRKVLSEHDGTLNEALNLSKTARKDFLNEIKGITGE
ncbi:MAG: hypothetical protein M0R40_00580 [Firmicutes bacterium]|nr:hypothetical protein [Bacillota bacterium]